MKDSRIGESLWSQWQGTNYHAQNTQAVIFFTEEHVDIHNDVVRRALASSLQRDGLVDSLGNAFSTLDGKTYSQHAYMGYLDGDIDPTFCDVNGMTIYGDEVEEVIPITLVDIYV